MAGEGISELARVILHEQQLEGYFFARIDSMGSENSTKGDTTYFFVVERGAKARVASLAVDGLSQTHRDELRSRFRTRTGVPFRLEDLEEDLLLILETVEADGHPLARVALEDVRWLGTARDSVAVRIEVWEGPSLSVESLDLQGAERTKSELAMRAVGLRSGQSLTAIDLKLVVERLERSGLFREIGDPEILETGPTTVRLRVPVVEEPPGSFDLLMGILPSGRDGQGGTLTGNGRLLLHNLLGYGRRLELQIDRRPGSVSSAEAGLHDPYVLGSAFRAGVRFNGYQQDSTYDNWSLRIEGGYRLADGLEISVLVSRASTRPGVAGAGSAGAVPSSESWFGGLGLQFDRRDNPSNPSRGLSVAMLLERGRKIRALTNASPESSNLSQQRFDVRMAYHVPIRRTLSLVAGLEARLLISDVIDPSDLFRLGGASSLRGYTEDRFRGRTVGRGYLEARQRLDRHSFVFLFMDHGFLQAVDETGEDQPWQYRPGFGFGTRYRTGLGFLSVSFAINPEEGLSGGKVHIGMSLGL